MSEIVFQMYFTLRLNQKIDLFIYLFIFTLCLLCLQVSCQEEQIGKWISDVFWFPNVLDTIWGE